MTRCIVIKTQFEAIHKWEDCPIEQVYYLRYPHRHVFHIIMKWKVNHDDRDKEFIFMKQQVNLYIHETFNEKNLGNMSCEQISDALKKVFPAVCFISVFEDNENGVEVIYD